MTDLTCPRTRALQASTQTLDEQTSIRRRLFVVALVGGLILGAAGSARAGGVPAFTATEQEQHCEMLVAAAVGPESWEEERVADFSDADQLLGEVAVHLCMARFDVALDRIRDGRGELASLPSIWQSDRRRARLEVMAATAKVALGQEESASRNFRWALELDPYLEMDAEETSPKVMRVYERSRQSWLASR